MMPGHAERPIGDSHEIARLAGLGRYLAPRLVQVEDGGPDVRAALPLLHHHARAVGDGESDPVAAGWAVRVKKHRLPRDAFNGQDVAAGARQPRPGDQAKEHRRDARWERVQQAIAPGYPL